MISLAPGVRVYGMRPEILLAIRIAEGVYDGEGLPLIITAIMDGAHMPKSLHYVGLAVDLHRPAVAPDRVGRKIREALGGDYDVVVEDKCIHVEFQPKAGY